MQHTWRAYRKTFLAGEYAACQYGRGFVLTYGPPFKMIQNLTDQLSAFGNSVTAKYPSLKGLSFIDTEQAHGGVGASSAELACIYQCLCDHGLEQPGDLISKRLWYRQHAWDGVGLPPSGIDFIAQIKPGLIWVDCEQNMCEQCVWPFTDYVWLVLKTNDKLNTHTHLKTLTHEGDFKALNDLLDPIKTALEQANLEGFIQAQRHYDQALHDRGFSTQAHQSLHEAIHTLPSVSYMRGCGAMGKDTWLVLTKRTDLSNTMKAIQAISATNIHYTIDLDTYDTN